MSLSNTWEAGAWVGKDGEGLIEYCSILGCLHFSISPLYLPSLHQSQHHEEAVRWGCREEGIKQAQRLSAAAQMAHFGT